MTQATTANPEQIEPTTIVSITMRYGGAQWRRRARGLVWVKNAKYPQRA